MDNYGLREFKKDIDKKLENIQKSIDKNVGINTHPIVLFILILIFLVIVDFWAAGLHMLVSNIHPRGYLKYWEYIILSVGLTLFLIFIARWFGLSLRSIEQQ